MGKYYRTKEDIVIPKGTLFELSEEIRIQCSDGDYEAVLVSISENIPCQILCRVDTDKLQEDLCDIFDAADDFLVSVTKVYRCAENGQVVLSSQDEQRINELDLGWDKQGTSVVANGDLPEFVVTTTETIIK